MTRVLLDVSVLATETRGRGIGRYVKDLALGLTSLGAGDLELLGLERIALCSEQVSRDVSAARLDQVQPLRRYRWAYALRLGLGRAVRRTAPDLVHSPFPNVTPLGRLRCPRIVTCHDLIPLRYPEHYLDWRDGWYRGRRMLDARRYGSADHVIAVSEASASDLVALLGVPAGKISVVPNGVDHEYWSLCDPEAQVLLAQRGIGPEPFLLAVAQPEWRKNPEHILHAFASARRSPGADGLRLIWASALSPAQRRKLERLADQHDVARFVRLVGQVSDAELRALYQRALALLFPSRSEGFGYPVVEAMAAGCPVVTSHGSSLSEVAGDAALLVDPERPEQISDAIVRLLGDAESRSRLVEKGRARAAQLSLRRMAERTLDVYRRIAHG